MAVTVKSLLRVAAELHSTPLAANTRVESQVEVITDNIRPVKIIRNHNRNLHDCSGYSV